MWPENAQSIDWRANGNSANAQSFLQNLFKQSSNCLVAWTTTQNEALGLELNDCVQALEWLTECLSSRDTCTSSCLLFIHELLKLDEVLLGTRAPHFRLMSLTSKGLLKVVKSRMEDLQNDLDGGLLVESYARRIPIELGRNPEERKKIKSYHFSQLTKLLAENLPRRESGLFRALEICLSIEMQEHGAGMPALLALAKDDSVSVLTLLDCLNKDYSILEQCLGQKPLDQLIAAIPTMSNHYELVAQIIGEKAVKENAQQFCQVFFSTSDISTLCVLIRAVMLYPSLIPGNLLIQVAFNAIIRDIASRLASNSSCLDDASRGPILARLAWSLHKDKLLNFIRSKGEIREPWKLEDAARITFIRVAPSSVALQTLSNVCQSITVASPAQCKQLGEQKKLALLVMQMERASVRNRVLALQQSDRLIVLESILVSVPFVGEVAIEALNWVAVGIESKEILVRIMDGCKLLFSSAPYLAGSLLGSLKNAPYVQTLSQDRVVGVENLIVELVAKASSSSSSGKVIDPLVLEEVLFQFASLCSMANVSPEFKDKLPVQFRHEFIEYLKRGRKCLLPIPRTPIQLNAETSFGGSTIAVPKVTKSIQQQHHHQQRSELDESLEMVKRLCQRMPVGELEKLQARLASIVSSELQSRTV